MFVKFLTALTALQLTLSPTVAQDNPNAPIPCTPRSVEPYSTIVSHPGDEINCPASSRIPG